MLQVMVMAEMEDSRTKQVALDDDAEWDGKLDGLARK